MPQQAGAVRVWLEGERGGASALLDGFKARVLKGGAAVEPPTRHLYATEWWPQPTLDASTSAEPLELLLLGAVTSLGLAQLQTAAGLAALQGACVRWPSVVAVATMTRGDVLGLAAVEAALVLLSTVAHTGGAGVLAAV